jgi:hypothetical protein
MIADQGAVDGSSASYASEVGAGALIPPELPAECGRTPSRALADFVRCRDMTCRFPGCDRPATCADIDHTLPSGDGGTTHASDLKYFCRLPSSAENLLGLARRATARRHCHLDIPVGRRVRHYARISAALPQPLPTDGHSARFRTRVREPLW